jgi:4-amino-4-deoxy-L-arabinose transferase-like glycosyltransferase
MAWLHKIKDHKISILIFVLSFFVHLIFLIVFLHFFGQDKLLKADSHNYLSLASTLLSQHQFSVNTGNLIMPESFRVPIYPLFLAICLSITKKIWFIALIQILISALSTVFVYKISQFFLKGKWAVVPSLIFISEPRVLYISILLMSETLFLLFILAGIYYLLKYFKNYNYLDLFFSICFLALSCLIKPVSYYLFFIIFLLSIFFIFKTKNKKKIIITILIFVFSYSMIILPWLIRNKIFFNEFELSNIKNYNLYFYNSSFLHSKLYGSKMGSENLNFIVQDLQDKAREHYTERSYSKDMSYFVYIRSLYANDYLKKESTEFILNNPIEYTKIHLKGMHDFFIKTHDINRWFAITNNKSLAYSLSDDEYSRYFPIVLLEKIYLIFIFLLFLSSLFFIPKKKRINFYILYATILYFAIVSSPISLGRFKYPVEAFIYILAVYSLHSLYRIYINKKNGYT